MEALFNEYTNPISNDKSGQFSSTGMDTSISSSENLEIFLRNYKNINLKREVQKLKLKNHIFDVFLWWKVNSPRFPFLSEMARDVLAIPVSSVASECASSTAGSSLTPRLVIAPVCLQIWIHSEPQPINSIMPRLHGSNARSLFWNHYEKLEENEDGSWTLKCIHCGCAYYHSHNIGTASLQRHVNDCSPQDLRTKAAVKTQSFPNMDASSSSSRLLRRS
uniref:HAT C-terminal dimerisation domain-containing protein n=1 Tax=Solanum lycopersicum TaxID=4081 RepID=A0A3Q7FHP9_SOLLC